MSMPDFSFSVYWRFVGSVKIFHYQNIPWSVAHSSGLQYVVPSLVNCGVRLGENNILPCGLYWKECLFAVDIRRFCIHQRSGLGLLAHLGAVSPCIAHLAETAQCSGAPGNGRTLFKVSYYVLFPILVLSGSTYIVSMLSPSLPFFFFVHPLPIVSLPYSELLSF